MSNGKKGRIRLYADVVFSYSRGVLRGVSDYCKLQGGWEFEFVPSINPDYMSSFKKADVRGVIIQARTHEQAEPLIRAGFPAVNVANVLCDPVALPSVFPDDRAIGAMAARYFLKEKNLRSFAYCGPSDQEFSRLRREGFCEGLKPHNVVPLKRPADDLSPDRERILKSLPRPVGIFCHNDACAREIVGELTGMGTLVPDEVAVLGVDDDEIQCEMSGVALSSIRLNTRQIGRMAASMLMKIIEGLPVPREPSLVFPLHVVTRRSTDMIALADAEVASAVRYLRDHVPHTNVQALVEHTRLARRTLELRFRKALGRSPAAEIRRVKIDRARSLLAQTDCAIREIADACGFKETRQLSTAFHEIFGLSPRQYRQWSRQDSQDHIPLPSELLGPTPPNPSGPEIARAVPVPRPKLSAGRT